MIAHGQKIETEAFDRGRVIRLQTVPNHLSVIELSEPVLEVAAGSPAYKVEWRGNKVFIQPVEREADTNLFIWTASGRLNYELVVVSSVRDAQFAIDQEPGAPVAKMAPPTSIENPVEAEKAKAAAEKAKLAAQLLFASQPVLLSGDLKRGRVQILLKDMLRTDDRIYVRYVIRNDSPAAYEPGKPDVFALRPARTSQSLHALAGTQLAGGRTRVTSEGQSAMKVVDAEVHSASIPAGGLAVGLIAFETPEGNGPAIVRFAFPSDLVGDVTALLVL